MRVNEQRSGPADPGASTEAGGPSGQRPRPAGLRDQRPAERRLWAAAAWIGGSLALFAVLLRISLSSPMNSDGANNALQAWDMLHGHLLLPGWIIGDASVYTFELPLYAIIEFFFGLTGVIFHIGAALTYLIVVAFSVALACANSHGPAVAARCAVVVGVLAAPIVTQQGVSILLAAPDHIGTSVFLLGSFLLIERAPARRFTPPLLAVILCAGQIGDGLVLYVGVPAVLLVSAYRILTARKIRTGDTAIAVAAAASVPLASLTRAVMLHFGGYAQVAPKTAISPIGQWPQHVVLACRAVRTLYGAFGATVVHAHAPLSGVADLFGLACLLAAAFGFAKVVWTWRFASRGEQLLCVAIVVNLAAYVASTLPSTFSSREIAAVLPCGAVLAARACVPSRIVGARRARAGLAAAALVALLPLAAAATLPPVTPAAVPLAAWLKAHGFTYGIAGYWDASSVTLQSGNQVQVRAVDVYPDRITGFYINAGYWEMKTDWYDASRHDATFVIANGHQTDAPSLKAAEVERYFGRPAATYRVAGREILIYRTNLLERLGRRSSLRRRTTASG
jgi:hypothetical protein